jgi:hypothetical protein
MSTILKALLDTVLPASEDNRMPSAAEMDFEAFLAQQAPDFLPVLTDVLSGFDDGFADQSLTERVAQVQGYASAEAATFARLVFLIYDCYYQNPEVRRLIGHKAGAIFPKGNESIQGDLSSLAKVQARGKGYRTPGSD